MIRKIPYSKIDFEKYQKCFEDSAQRKYSASMDYLRVVAGKYIDVLVYGDYEAVMPVVYNRNFLIKRVVRPKLCQQLGIYSKEDDKELNQKFLEFLKKNYIIASYCFNAKNNFVEELPTRRNFLIPVGNYENVYNNYSPKRKRKLRIDPSKQDLCLIQRETTFKEEYYEFMRQYLKGLKPKDIDVLMDYIKTFHNSGKIFFQAFYFEGKLICLLVLYQDSISTVLIGTINHPEFLRLNASSILIDQVIKDCISTHVFDFEGSELPAIAEFFSGFRPEVEYYPYI